MIVKYSRRFVWSSSSYTGDCAVTTCQCAQGDQWSVPGSQVIGQHMAITSPRLLITPCSITTTQLSLPTPLHGLVQRINSFLNNLHRSYFLVVGFKWGMILSLYAGCLRDLCSNNRYHSLSMQHASNSIQKASVKTVSQAGAVTSWWSEQCWHYILETGPSQRSQLWRRKKILCEFVTEIRHTGNCHKKRH